MDKRLEGRRYINGSWGELWWDGEKIAGISKFELKITPEREDVPGDGLDMDSKIVALKVEGSFTVKKIYSRSVDKLVKNWLQGLDPRSTLIGKLADPDTYGSERVTISNVWFNESAIMQFEKKKTVEEEYKFGCTASGIRFDELISN